MSESVVLWQTPLMKFKLDHQETIDEIENIATDGGKVDSSIRTDILSNSVLFKEWVLSCSQEYCNKFYPEFHISGIQRGWMNNQKQYEHTGMHTHASNQLAAVYYIDVDNRHPPLEIIDPRAPHIFNTSYIKRASGISSTDKSFFVHPSNHTMVIFPGYLLHGVGTNLIDKTRKCVAMNLDVRLNT